MHGFGDEQVGPNILLMSDVAEGGEGLWTAPMQSVVPLGRRSHAAHSAAEAEEHSGEAPCAQASYSFTL
jgi:hypothetical protein